MLVTCRVVFVTLLTYLLTYLFTYLLTYLLTPWSRVLLEKLTGFHLYRYITVETQLNISTQ